MWWSVPPTPSRCSIFSRSKIGFLGAFRALAGDGTFENELSAPRNGRPWGFSLLQCNRAGHNGFCRLSGNSKVTDFRNCIINRRTLVRLRCNAKRRIEMQSDKFRCDRDGLGPHRGREGALRGRPGAASLPACVWRLSGRAPGTRNAKSAFFQK